MAALRVSVKAHHAFLRDVKVSRSRRRYDAERASILADLLYEYTMHFRMDVPPPIALFETFCYGGREAAMRRYEAWADGEVLRRFAADNQNIHTTMVVSATLANVELLLRQEVPPQFRWNEDACSQTPAAIIAACDLSPAATINMVRWYCPQGDSGIYELGPGIYGRVLDAVWQNVAASAPDSGLRAILRQELEDSVGMCAQGNLSRLCNVLAGYAEGLAAATSPTERAANLLSQLTGDNLVERGRTILRESGVPEAQWDAWLEPLTA